MDFQNINCKSYRLLFFDIIYSELIKASIEFAERGGDILVKIREDASKGGDLGEESKGDHPEIKGCLDFQNLF